MPGPVRPGWCRTGWLRRPRSHGALAQAVALILLGVRCPFWISRDVARCHRLSSELSCILVGFRWCRYGPYVLFGVCACYVRRRLDILVCGHLVWSCISRDAWKLGVSISVLEFTRCSSVPPFIPWAIVYVSRGQFFVVPLWSLCLPRRLRLLCPAAFGNSCLRSACRFWASRVAWKCPRLSLERSYE